MSLENVQKSRYIMVMERIKKEIKEGHLVPGERLPSENVYAKQLGVSRATLREALRILEEENIISRKHGIGTFVNQVPVFSSGIEELNSITEMIHSAGKRPGTEVLLSKYVTPTEEDKEKLQLQDGERILLVKRVRTADDRPLVYCIDKVPARLFSEESHLLGGSLFNFLEQEAEVHIDYATADITTVGYHEDISARLKCSKKIPLLVLKQLHYSTLDKPVLYSINFFRSDQFSFNVLRKRTQR
ncbi:GntR family transcriptional regulator [Pullulanibacillus camelliae]|uniref:GntR family transcriptional regulator n=1 Tax=Pullulanibacillus camelliae TaxID=1707096 RepID=A0A8J2VKC2_9BACL|nr:GntR family transcriptional regulator [Pullulanibacillus camelliae]GGE29859.1 GntR family transcriptional regulator [Pullulanibacillus camelliae]